MIRKCPKCNKFLQFTDNEYNDWTYLKCPNCYTVFTDEKYVTVEQRIQQGYFRYESAEESFAHWMKENIIDNDEF